jgi:serine/threonine protein kinase
VHRDLKPQIIMIKSLKERVAKLIDFDMARETKHGVSSSISIQGTEQYNAPEILQNGGCSVASNMWACALVALFIWYGLTPVENPDRKKIEESAHPKLHPEAHVAVPQRESQGSPPRSHG